MDIFKVLNIHPNSRYGRLLRPYIENSARYEWLRAGGDYTLACINPDAGTISGENLDAVIDAARREKK